LAERRWIILIFSFWIGASTHFILINWDLGIFPPPPFYSPTLVAFLFELLGPMLAYNRPLLLLNTIGIASCVCFTYAYIYACFTFTYFYTSMIAIASSFYSMQQHLADPKLVITLIFGHYQWNRNPDAIKPDTLEERYTLLLRGLH
ncbi:unnamed protein product, partial [Onchocerca ochengi]